MYRRLTGFCCMVTKRAYIKGSKSNISMNYTMAFYSAIEKNGTVSPGGKWTECCSSRSSLNKPDSEGQRQTGLLWPVCADQPVYQPKAALEALSPPFPLVPVTGERSHFCHTGQCKGNPFPSSTRNDLPHVHTSVQSWGLRVWLERTLCLSMSECLIISNKCFYIGSLVFAEIVS